MDFTFDERMKIRKAVHPDVDAIVSILESTSEVSSVVNRGRDANTSIIRTNLERVLQSDTSTVFVAETEEGRPVGYCTVHWTPFLFLEGGEAYVTELFIHAQSRGEGIGSALLNRMEEEARERGCSRLSLLNGRKSEAYERSFYRNRNCVEREAMANFVLNIETESNQSAHTTSASAPR